MYISIEIIRGTPPASSSESYPRGSPTSYSFIYGSYCPAADNMFDTTCDRIKITPDILTGGPATAKDSTTPSLGIYSSVLILGFTHTKDR